VAGDMASWPDDSYRPRGSYADTGTSFALFLEIAEQADLCRFGDDGAETQVALREVDRFIRHGCLPGVGLGQRHGYREA
jgi:isoamylase